MKRAGRKEIEEKKRRSLKRERGSLRGTSWRASQVWVLGAFLMHASSQSLVLIISDLDTWALSYNFIVYWVAWICLIYSFYIDLFAQPFINHVIPLSFFVNPSLHLLLSLHPRISIRPCTPNPSLPSFPHHFSRSSTSPNHTRA